MDSDFISLCADTLTLCHDGDGVVSISSLGVYVRDIVQTTGIVTTILLFLSPVFFPVSALPSEFQPWLKLNPLTFVIEASRSALIFGGGFDWVWWTWYLIGSLAVAWAGFWWFQKTRPRFCRCRLKGAESLDT